MLKKVFQTGTTSNRTWIQPVLLIRVGEKHLVTAITDHASQELVQLCYYLEEEGLTAEQAREMLDQDIPAGISFYQVTISAEFPGHSLLSTADQLPENSLLWSAPGMHQVSEKIPEWQLVNIYPVPAALYQLLLNRYPAARFCNQFTAGLKRVEAGAAGGLIQLDIRHQDFTAWVIRDGRLLLTQCGEYEIPDDIIYYLLRISRQFHLSQQETQLQISGLIDQDSVLYKELFQYFLRISFRNPAWAKIPSEYPSHFFTSLNDLELCVS